MFWTITVFVIIMLTLFVIKILEQHGKKQDNSSKSTASKLNVDRRSSVLTNRELSFYKLLLPSIPPHMVLLCKVRMEDVLKVKGTDFKDITNQRNQIKSRHFDFVLCGADTLEPYCAIELDDSSHESKKQIHGDAIKNQACKNAEMFLFRIKEIRKIKPIKDFIKEISSS